MLAMTRMLCTIALSFWLPLCGMQAAWSADGSATLRLSISIAADGWNTTGHETRSLSFREPHPHFHVPIPNISTNEVRLWKEDCSWGYEALSLQVADAGANQWTAKKRPRPWRSNYPRWWLLKPSETLTIDVYFADSKVWDGFRHPPKDSSLKLNLSAVYEIQSDERTKEHQIWSGRIVSTPVEVTFYD